jgi:hypothetical protein
MVEGWQKELKVLFTGLLDEYAIQPILPIQRVGFAAPPSGVHDNKTVVQAAKMNL